MYTLMFVTLILWINVIYYKQVNDIENTAQSLVNLQ